MRRVGWLFMRSYDQAAERVLDGGDVGAAEQVDVHHEEVELVERHPRLAAGRQRKRLLVGGEDPAAEAAEETHHRQIDLAMAAVHRRVDQARLTLLVGHGVAAPQIAVQARRRLGRADQVFAGGARRARSRGAWPGWPADRRRPGGAAARRRRSR